MSRNSRVTRSHGNNGVVKSKFKSNIPPHAFGASVRVVRVSYIFNENDELTVTFQMMYPSTV